LTFDVANYFDVTQEIVLEWIKLGLLKADVVEGVFIIHSQDFSSFKNKYLTLRQVAQKLNITEKEYLKTTVKNLTKYSVLPVYYFRGNYLFGLYEQIEVEKYIQGKKEEEYYTIEETAKKLKVSLSIAYSLMQNGILSEDKINNCRLIKSECIEVFREKYLWLSLLSNVLDLQDSYIYKYLKKHGVMPLNAIKPFIYEKEEVMICLCQNPLLGKTHETMLQLTNEMKRYK
jgi:hypothetical protein